MENPNGNVVPACGARSLHIPHGNRLHVRVTVRGNELEVTDERADNETAAADIQGLIQAFAGLLKPTEENDSVTTRIFGGKAENPGEFVENQESKAEILRVQQLVQKSEGEITQLRQLLQESKAENEDLKNRYRSATHGRAMELAQRFSGINTMEVATIDHEPESEDIEGSSDQYTPEQRATEVILNPKVREIDFLSLEDILENENGSGVTFRSRVEDVTEEDESVVGNNSTSSDNDSNFGDLLLQTFERPKAAPPTILKVGLDVGIARLGGDYKLESSHGNLPRRNPYRGRWQNGPEADTEGDDTILSAPRLPRSKKTSMVDTYDIRYKPSPDDPMHYKAVLIGNLPQDINYQRLLAKVRGGRIISATLCNTSNIRGCGGRMSALIVFVEAASARAYIQFANTHGIYFDSQKCFARLIGTPTYPLSEQAKVREEREQTRCLLIGHTSSGLSLGSIDRAINTGVNQYRVDAMEKLWKDGDGNILIHFASINAASLAFWRLKEDPNQDYPTMSFDDDPCGGPLSELLPNPTGHSFCHLLDTNVNYDDDTHNDDSGEKSTEHHGSVSSPTRSGVANADEIELDEGDDDAANDNDEGAVKDNATVHDGQDNQVAKGQSEHVVDTNNVSGAINIDERQPAGGLSLKFAEANEDLPVSAKNPVKMGHCEESQAFKSLDGSESDGHASNEVAPGPEEVSIVEDSPMAEDLTAPELATCSPPIPRIAKRVPDSWADDVNEAIEAGTLDPPMELKAVPPSTALINVDRRNFYPATKFLPTIAEEGPAICEPVEEEVHTRSSGVEASSTESTAVEEKPEVVTSTRLLATKALPIEPASQIESAVETIGRPVVRLPHSKRATLPDRFDLSGTDLDPTLLVRHAIVTAISGRPRGGLSSSRWATPDGKPTAVITMAAPLAAPVLGDNEGVAAELLFGKSCR